MGMGCAQLTIHKFIQFKRKEQILSENKLARKIAIKNAAKETNYEKSRARLAELLKLHSTFGILKQFEGLLLNLDL